MNVLKTQKQYERLSCKGINTSRNSKKTFLKYNYFNLINAYKPLFVKEAKTISDIKKMCSSSDNIFLKKYYG